MTPQVRMLMDCVKILEEGGHRSTSEAFEMLVQWIAVRIKLPSGRSDYGISTPTVKMETAEALDRTLDIVLLQRDVADHLYEAGVALGVITPIQSKGTLETPVNDAESIPAILDPDAKTGTHLLELYKKYGRDFVYYGVVNNTLHYRMALVTMHLFGVPSMILKADPKIHNIALTSSNWYRANQWWPPNPKNLESASDSNRRLVINTQEVDSIL